MIAQDLFAWVPPAILGDRHGITYDRKRDLDRLNDQMRRVYDVLQSGEWLSLSEIHDRILNSTGKYDPEASISARIRDLRKPKFGGFNVEKRHVTHGLWEYRIA